MEDIDTTIRALTDDAIDIEHKILPKDEYGKGTLPEIKGETALMYGIGPERCAAILSN